MNTAKMIDIPAVKNTKVNSAMLRGAKPQLSEHDQLKKQAETLVAQTFFGTLLKQMRESPFKSEMFSGGRGEQAFGPMYDQVLSQRMAHGAGSKLVNALVRKLEANKSYAKQQIKLNPK